MILPPRPAYLRRNDARITEAIVKVIARGGVGRLGAASVAAEVGSSVRPVHDRFRGTTDMAIHVWRSAIEAPLRRDLTDLTEASDGATLTERFEPFIRPNATYLTAAELLLAAAFDPRLHAAIGERRLIVDAARDERGAYLTALALGLLMVARRPHAAHASLRGFADRLAAALRSTTPAPPAPELPPAYNLHDAGIILHSGDALRDDLLIATLELIGERGYDQVRVKEIAAAVGVSEGYVFKRYDTKLDLFLDATALQQRRDFGVVQQLVADVALASGPGLAEAVLLREFGRAGRERARNILHEQTRRAWFEPRARAVADATEAALIAQVAAANPTWDSTAVAEFIHVELALGLGHTSLALHAPEAWRLPFANVTVPLLG
jgi:AcrR family transcriptional regulator